MLGTDGYHSPRPRPANAMFFPRINPCRRIFCAAFVAAASVLAICVILKITKAQERHRAAASL
ncbi:hypothetical protein E1294_50790 [Nonomuraea diastatica]|uniref:Uncharacterized protein n=1 Tax=Nonomuraea diastatica TaxID=1848329 RepID=A0A4R4VDI9_9ACTN|nr:hypothetical protein E1294_50790 [Nonomuraea diastatica]